MGKKYFLKINYIIFTEQLSLQTMLKTVQDLQSISHMGLIMSQEQLPLTGITSTQASKNENK